MAIPPLVLRVIADSTGVKKGMAQSKAQVSGFKNVVKQNAGLIGIALAGAAVAFGASAVKSFNESEAAIAQTNAVLKSTQGIAGVTAAEVTTLATSMQKLTTFSDEEVRSAENMLLTFTNISDEIFPETTEATLNMSQALGQDLKSSSIQLGKALNDPILGLTSLGRVGVKFTQGTRDQIKAMVEAGNVMGAQKVILHELATEFGGSARAATKTFGGQVKQLGNEFDDVKEDIGKLIVVLEKQFLPVLRFIMKAISKMVANIEIMSGAVAKAATWFADKFINPTVKAWQDFVGLIGNGVGLIRRAFVGAWQAIRGPVLAVIHAITWAVEGLVNIVQAAVDALQFLAKLNPFSGDQPAGLSPGPGRGVVPHAMGGPVSAWKPYLVGEQGPELFVPKTSGTIVPNGQFASQPQTINVYVGDEKVERVVVKALNRAAVRMGA
jgi:phage-related minor tail protein